VEAKATRNLSAIVYTSFAVGVQGACCFLAESSCRAGSDNSRIYWNYSIISCKTGFFPNGNIQRPGAGNRSPKRGLAIRIRENNFFSGKDLPWGKNYFITLPVELI
jgi:hypothetical protein